MTATTATTATTAAHRSERSTISILLDTIERSARAAAVPFVRLAIAALMLWFGVPKLISGASPAEDLAVRTIEVLTGGLLGGDAARIAIGVSEVAIGVALVVGRAMPLVLLAVLGHMAGTVTPLLLFPAETWRSPMVGSLEGQYIIKNVVIVAGVVVLAGWGMRRRRP